MHGQNHFKFIYYLFIVYKPTKIYMQLDYGGIYELYRKCNFSVRNYKISKLANIWGYNYNTDKFTINKMDHFILEDEDITFLRNVGSTYPARQRHIPEDQNPEKSM